MRRIALVAGAMALALGGCVDSRILPTVGSSFDLFGPLSSAGLHVRLSAPSRRVQTVPATWTSVQFTLANSTLLASNRTQTVLKASNFNDTGAGTAATSATTLFPTSRPGDYTLFGSTYNAAVRNAMGYAAVTLTANAAATVTMTLSTLPEWTAGTLAGTGTQSYSGDGGGDPALATLNSPRGIAFDGTGRMFIADSGNNRIRMINTARTAMSLVDGDGTTTPLNAPSALAYDSTHDALYIADSGNNRIRYVPAPGTGGTLSGSTIALTASPTGLAYDATRDSLYVSLANHTVVEVTTVSAATGSPAVIMGTTDTSGDTTTTALGTAVLLNTPKGLAVDGTATYLYVSDAGNHRIRRMTLAGRSTSIVAGSGTNGNAGDGALAASASIGTPDSLAYDTTDGGRLYILDTANFVVRAMTVSNGMIATVFGTGVSSYAGNAGSTQAASLFAPSGLGFYQSGSSIYVSESGLNGHRIRSGS